MRHSYSTLVSQSFWSYDRFMEIAGLKAVIPPLGIITVTPMPKDWDIRFYDRNVNPETDGDWEWCDILSLCWFRSLTSTP